MRFSKAYIKTLKETPKEAEIASHKLMLRAGMIKKLASGIYAYLPLGYRTIKKIENINTTPSKKIKLLSWWGLRYTIKL